MLIQLACLSHTHRDEQRMARRQPHQIQESCSVDSTTHRHTGFTTALTSLYTKLGHLPFAKYRTTPPNPSQQPSAQLSLPFSIPPTNQNVSGLRIGHRLKSSTSRPFYSLIKQSHPHRLDGTQSRTHSSNYLVFSAEQHYICGHAKFFLRLPNAPDIVNCSGTHAPRLNHKRRHENPYIHHKSLSNSSQLTLLLPHRHL